MTKLTIDGQLFWDKQEVLDYTTSIGRPIKGVTFQFYVDTHKIAAAAHLGRTPLYAPDEMRQFFRADRAPGPKKQPSPPGYYSIDELAAALGLDKTSIGHMLRNGAIAPDYVPTKGKLKGRRFFNQATLDAMKRGEHYLRKPAWVKALQDETVEQDETGA